MKIAIVFFLAVACLTGMGFALTAPACDNPVAHLKFEFSKPGMVCVVHAFDQDIVIER